MLLQMSRLIASGIAGKHGPGSFLFTLWELACWLGWLCCCLEAMQSLQSKYQLDAGRVEVSWQASRKNPSDTEKEKESVRSEHSHASLES